MKKLTLTIIAALALGSFSAAQVEAHGGGCRKSSPAGQCCHADNRNGGRVHCH
ncbi:MAG: hypothetical protein Q4G36_09545 [Paracoccus sp. (in: a-proteobacteria)]|nr:hypothetical protein [Paracoccus sp. (in: a-proteobacteria)]